MPRGDEYNEMLHFSEHDDDEEDLGYGGGGSSCVAPSAVPLATSLSPIDELARPCSTGHGAVGLGAYGWSSPAGARRRRQAAIACRGSRRRRAEATREHSPRTQPTNAARPLTTATAVRACAHAGAPALESGSVGTADADG